MAVATSLIPGLDEIVRGDDPKRRDEAARRICELFFEGAEGLSPRHVEFFDGILTKLVPRTDLLVRADIADQLASVSNAPRNLVCQLALDDEIVIAGPLLRFSPVIDEGVLVEIAREKSQEHLLAMTERPTLSSGLTDVIVDRGDQEVVRAVAGNTGAAFSSTGFSTLVKRASHDGLLTLTVGQRDDIPDENLKDLLAGSLDVIRRRLVETVKPSRQAAIKRAMSDISNLVLPEARRDFDPALRAVRSLQKAGNLTESALLLFAKAYKYEESIAALSAMSGVRIATLDRLISGDRYDPILIVSKVIGLEWATVRALILLRTGPNRVPSQADLEGARVNFTRLMPATAERVVNFWKARQAA